MERHLEEQTKWLLWKKINNLSKEIILCSINNFSVLVLAAIAGINRVVMYVRL